MHTAASKLLEVEIVGRENIKPSSPTPNYLKNFKRSLLDQIAPVHYIPFLYFYATTNKSKPSLISQHLKTSLSQTLTKFYPYAGKIKDHSTIYCNDDGVVFVEAQATCFLSDVLHQPDYKLLRELIPIQLGSKKAAIGPLLLIQATFFKCGGMAIAYCFSHQIVDGPTVATFINRWAAATARECSQTLLPQYITTSLFPAEDSFVPFAELSGKEYVTKRFVFGESQISTLQNKVASSCVPKPTRIEAVAMLVWNCILSASRSIRGSPSLSMLLLAMNMRKIIVPPLPEDSAGNTIGYFSIQKRDKEAIELQDLVCRVRKSKDEFKKNGLKTILQNKSLLSILELEDKQVKEDEIHSSLFSSLCRYPLYEADFGWGKPIWMTIPYDIAGNLVMFTDTRDAKGIKYQCR